MDGAWAMEKVKTDLSRRAARIREIAQGIFDKAERQTVLKFVADAEKLAARKVLVSKRPS
jgi:hypothetical protein